MTKIFTDHPASVGESYFQHLVMSFSFAFKLIGGGLACLIHGLFPFLCQTTGSQLIKQLHSNMVTHRDARIACVNGDDVDA